MIPFTIACVLVLLAAIVLTGARLWRGIVADCRELQDYG